MFSNLVTVFRSKLALRPNCFLTRRPLCFIPPPRTWFNYRAPWSDLVGHLQRHGYEARLLPWPFRGSPDLTRALHLNASLASYSHLFVDGATFSQQEAGFLNFIQQNASTLTVIAPSAPLIPAENLFFLHSPTVPTRWHYYAHQTWLRWQRHQDTLSDHTFINPLNEDSLKRVLLHGQRLAELDFQMD
jgi:hypothetical protein